MKESGKYEGEYTEENWSFVPKCSAYEKSKTLAEKAAWEFLEKLDENDKFELSVINPSYIQGPNIVNGDFSSGVLISALLNKKYPGMPAIKFGYVDVRDCA